jgi:HD-like signal output (HDOD) protein
MQLATAAETAVIEDLVERIGISETLNLLAAVCAVHALNYGEGLTAQRYNKLGVSISELADTCEGW